MFVAIQLPFADTRKFVNTETYNLSIPVWPFPTPGKEFIRSSGVIKQRCLGGLDDWPCEENFCHAARALRFQSCLSNYNPGYLEPPLSLKCKFRRFMFDGTTVSRVELGFRVVNRNEKQKISVLNEKDCLDFINGCFSLPVRVSSNNRTFVQCELLECRRYLARHYLQSTTQKYQGKLAFTEDWWFSFGTPAMLIEYYADEIKELPKFSNNLTHQNLHPGVLYYSRMERNGEKIGVWFICLDKVEKIFIRLLRLNLFRLHAEMECLRQTLRLIIQNKIIPEKGSEPSDRLQKYLLDSIRFLKRDLRDCLPQSKFFEAAYDFINIVNPGERATLLSQLSTIRKNIHYNLEKITQPKRDGYVNNFHIIGNPNIFNGEEQNIGGITMSKYNVNVGKHAKIGNLGVAETIQGSFNKITTSENQSQALKDKLNELSYAVAEMSNHLKDQGKTAARDLENLINEALSENPRKKNYKLFAENLIDAAKAVGTLASPVIEGVNALLALLK